LVEMPLEKCPMEDQERVGRLALRWMLEWRVVRMGDLGISVVQHSGSTAIV
jgi:hypothetical protein